MAQVEIESALPVRNGTEAGETILEVHETSPESRVVTATQLDIDDLTFADDKVDASGSQNVEVVQPTAADLNATVVATQLDIDDLKPGVAAGDDGVLVYGSDDAGTTPRIVLTDAAGRVATDANLQVGDTDVSAGNPVPVTITSSTPATPKNGYTELDGIGITTGIGASDEDAFEVGLTDGGPEADDKFNEIYASASGKIKVEIHEADDDQTVDQTFIDALQDGTATGYIKQHFTGFNSTADPAVKFHFENDLDIGTGKAYYVIVTNLDNQAQSAYVHTGGFTA